jgi:hypothetical protein
MSKIDFTKPIQFKLDDGVAPILEDVTYIGPYQNKHVIADAEGEYHTVYESSLRNKPVKLSIKQLYDQCVHAAMVDGMPWANKQALFELLYQELVQEGLIKEEN